MHTSKTKNYNNLKSNFVNGYYSVKFRLGNQQIETKSTRVTLFTILTKVGALFAFIFRFSKLMLGPRQNFSLATNFMRKIYSVNGSPDKKFDDHDGEGQDF